MKHAKICQSLLFGAILFLSLEKAAAVLPPVLLTIDDSNPSAVKFTATGVNSIVNDSSTTANSGVDLLSFFQTPNGSDFFYEFLSGGTLSGGNSGAIYNDIYTDNQSTGGGEVFLDLSLYTDIASPGQGNTQYFFTTQPAFTGSWTVDFASQGITSADLPVVGTVGNIQSGVSGNVGQILGSWQVVTVPEPALGSLAMIGLALGVLWRKRSLLR